MTVLRATKIYDPQGSMPLGTQKRVLQQASEEVQDLLATDPELCEEENINLQHYLEIFFEDQKSRLNL